MKKIVLNLLAIGSAMGVGYWFGCNSLQLPDPNTMDVVVEFSQVPTDSDGGWGRLERVATLVHTSKGPMQHGPQFEFSATGLTKTVTLFDRGEVVERRYEGIISDRFHPPKN